MGFVDFVGHCEDLSFWWVFGKSRAISVVLLINSADVDVVFVFELWAETS